MNSAQPIIAFHDRKIAIDLPHLAFASAIAAWSIWFCRDAWISGPDVENLILIAPATAAAVCLYGFVAASCFQVVENSDPLGAAPGHKAAKGNGIKIAGTMALFAAFVAAGPLIGFDIATFLYLFAMMALLGERRILVLLLVPLLFCIAAIYCFNYVLATPLPLHFFSGDGG